ncbi:MAG: TetR/AcrR family transcriptional regulator [bacterium]|nr:TetR/AcrR family transcriptional regulator [bacterium]
MSTTDSKLEPKNPPHRKPRREAQSKAKAKTGQSAAKDASRRDEARTRMYRDLVFESAECVFGQKGFDSTTMQDIAQEAGVSLKTLYASYPGKQELYKEIQRVRGKAFVEGVLVAAAMGRSPREKLALTVRSHVDFLFAHRDWLSFRLRTRVSWGIRPDDEDAAHYWELGLRNISDILSAGMEEGIFYLGNPDQVAAVVQGVMQVEVTRAVEDGASEQAPAAEGIMLHLDRLLCPPGLPEDAR